jgi:hypothetical protein
MINADATAENKPDCANPHGISSPAVPKCRCSTQPSTYKNKCSIQIFIVLLLKVPVVFFRFPLKLVVEVHPGVTPNSSIIQHGLQGIAEGVFQAMEYGERTDALGLSDRVPSLIERTRRHGDRGGGGGYGE